MANQTFHVVSLDEAGNAVLRKRLTRSGLMGSRQHLCDNLW